MYRGACAPCRLQNRVSSWPRVQTRPVGSLDPAGPSVALPLHADSPGRAQCERAAPLRRRRPARTDRRWPVQEEPKRAACAALNEARVPRSSGPTPLYIRARIALELRIAPGAAKVIRFAGMFGFRRSFGHSELFLADGTGRAIADFCVSGGFEGPRVCRGTGAPRRRHRRRRPTTACRHSKHA